MRCIVAKNTASLPEIGIYSGLQAFALRADESGFVVSTDFCADPVTIHFFASSTGPPWAELKIFAKSLVLRLPAESERPDQAGRFGGQRSLRNLRRLLEGRANSGTRV